MLLSALALTPLAAAAEPDLAGVHVALGLTLDAPLVDSPIVGAPSVDGGLRLHAGPRVLVELGVSAGVGNDDSLDQSWSLDDEGQPELSRHSETRLSELSVGGGLRVAYRVNAKGPVGFYTGLGATVVSEEGSGPWLEEATDDDGTVTIEEVGTYTSTTRYLSVDASLTAVHWVTDRVAVSGTLGVPFAVLRSASVTYTRDGGSAPYDEDVSEDTTTAFGAWPRVGGAVHLRL